MTFEELTDNLPLLTGGLFVISLIFILVSLIYFRRGRRAPYWMQRRTAGEQGLRILMISVFFMVVTAISCGVTVFFNYIDVEPEETPIDTSTAVSFETNIADPVTVFPTSEDTLEPSTTPVSETIDVTVPTAEDATLTPEPTTLEPSATVVDEPEPSATSISTEITASPDADNSTSASQPNQVTSTTVPQKTIEPTATETSIPPTATETPEPEPSATLTAVASPTETLTETPSATLPPTETPTLTATPTPAITVIRENTDLEPLRAPSTQADLDIVVIASGVSERQQPLNSGVSFGADLTRLYYFVSYENMMGGSLWTAQLYRAGNLVYERQSLWGNIPSGETYFFISLPDGFVAGDYQLQLSIGEQTTPRTTKNFTVNE